MSLLNKGKYICIKCDKKFVRKYHLIQHMTTKTDCSTRSYESVFMTALTEKLSELEVLLDELTINIEIDVDVDTQIESFRVPPVIINDIIKKISNQMMLVKNMLNKNQELLESDQLKEIYKLYNSFKTKYKDCLTNYYTQKQRFDVRDITKNIIDKI